ncbi:MAG TPA: type I secretion protein TolC [Coxiellaceae bacterium]|nr:type I secretion protein TolC [Coxiellaceae bacterium]
MKRYKLAILSTILILCGNLVFTTAFAVNLMDVYKKALVSDPTFKAANATWLANRENLAIARSKLLPQLTASGNISRTREQNESPLTNGTSISYDNNSGYSLQLTQTIFNFGNWANVWGAQATIKQAEATFLAAQEDLLQRTATAYFNVLQAKDTLYYTKANKEAVARLLNQAKHKFDVGLIPIADLEDARATHDTAVASEIAAINDLSNAFESLSEITGVRYLSLDSVKADFPLISPQPADIEKWAKAAEQQNFDIIAARFASIAARENVKQQNAGHLPTLTASGSYAYAYDGNLYPQNSFNRNKTASVGAQLSVPLFQGGGVVAATRQADYQYQQALANLDLASRSNISKTRQAYLGILSNISKIKADKQAIKSAKSSLRATQASYTAGLRTMADVLTAQTQLYNAQNTFATDEYNYINQLLQLKQLTGILNADDLSQINSWLEKPMQIAKNNIPAEQHLTKRKQPQTSTKFKSKTIKSPVATNKNRTNKIVVLSAGEVKQVDSDGDNIKTAMATPNTNNNIGKN